MENGNEMKTVVPILRFPEFKNTEGWKEYKLKSLCEIGNGKDYKHLGRGHHPSAAGRFEGHGALRGLQARRTHRHHAPGRRGARDRDRQDALRLGNHRRRRGPGPHPARQIAVQNRFHT